MSGSATAVFHVSNLHGTTRAVVHSVDNFVVDGVVQPRPFAGLLRGADELIPAGQVVRVLGVEAIAGRQNDFLRVTVVTPGNAVAPVVFVLPPNGARTMAAPQLVALVLPVLTPASAPGASITAQTHAPVPSALPAWTVRRTAAGSEAILRGTAQNQGRTTPALLVLGCPSTEISQMRPALSPFVELRVPKSSVLFDVLFVGDKDGDDNGYVHVQVGKALEIKADLAVWTQIPDTGNIAPLGLDLIRKEMEEIIGAPSSPLRVAVLPTDKPETGVSARFLLPADVTPALSSMTPCLDHAKSTEVALHASRSAECPEVPDLVLVDADVRNATTGKPLTGQK